MRCRRHGCTPGSIFFFPYKDNKTAHSQPQPSVPASDGAFESIPQRAAHLKYELLRHPKGEMPQSALGAQHVAPREKIAHLQSAGDGGMGTEGWGRRDGDGGMGTADGVGVCEGVYGGKVRVSPRIPVWCAMLLSRLLPIPLPCFNWY